MKILHQAGAWCALLPSTTAPKIPFMVDLTSCKGWKSAKPVLRPNSIITFWFRFRRMPNWSRSQSLSPSWGPHQLFPGTQVTWILPALTLAIVNIVHNVDNDRIFRDIFLRCQQTWGPHQLLPGLPVTWIPLASTPLTGTAWLWLRENSGERRNSGRLAPSRRLCGREQQPAPDAMSRLWGCCGRKVEDDGLQQQLVASLQQAVEAAAEQSSPNLEPASKTRRPAVTTTTVAGIIIVTQCINISTSITFWHFIRTQLGGRRQDVKVAKKSGNTTFVFWHLLDFYDVLAKNIKRPLLMTLVIILGYVDNHGCNRKIAQHHITTRASSAGTYFRLPNHTLTYEIFLYYSLYSCGK